MALLQEEDDYSLEDKRSNKGTEADTLQKTYSTSKLAIVVKFGGHVLHCIASNLSM